MILKQWTKERQKKKKREKKKRKDWTTFQMFSVHIYTYIYTTYSFRYAESHWYNHTGWRGVKRQVIYLLTRYVGEATYVIATALACQFGFSFLNKPLTLTLHSLALKMECEGREYLPTWHGVFQELIVSGYTGKRPHAHVVSSRPKLAKVNSLKVLKLKAK